MFSNSLIFHLQMDWQNPKYTYDSNLPYSSFHSTQVPIIVNNNTSTPSKSFERLIDGRSTPDFEYFSQVLPPELARQIMMGKSFHQTLEEH